MDICEIKMPTNNVAKQLKNYTGFNKIRDARIILETFSNDDTFTNEFINYYQDKYKIKDIPNPNGETSEVKKLASDVIDFYYNNHPNIDHTVRDDVYDKSYEFGYTSTFEREKGKEHVATIIIKEFEKVNRSDKAIEKDKVKHYLDAAKKTWLKHIFIISSKTAKKSIKELNEEYKNAQNKEEYIDKLLGGKIKTISANNIFAVYKELFGKNSGVLYLNEVLANNKTADVLHQLDKELEQELHSTQIATDDIIPDDNSQLDSSDEMYDVTITQYNQHSGIYTTFMAHVGQRIRNYFNSLYKLNSPKEEDYDTNNSYGLPETMDANACSSMLYNSPIFDNIDTMIEGIREIGNRVKGFEAFVQFAKDLKTNPDFAYEVFTVFARTKMQKIETIYKDGEISNRISNNEADPNYVFIFSLSNDARSTAKDSYNSTLYRTKIKNIKTSINDTNKLIKANIDETDAGTKENNNKIINARLANAKTKIVNLIKTYFPSISEKAIISYIEINNNDSDDKFVQFTNILNLLQDIENINNKVPDVNKAYNEMLSYASSAKEHNDKLREAEFKGQYVDRTDYISLTKIYSDDYTRILDPYFNSLSNKLLKYSIIDTNLNSRNIHGNNNSNIINNSWLTGFKKMLDDTYVDDKGNYRNTKLEKWGTEKLKTNQYKYSNLLLEQYDENGNIINKGKAIFRYVDGQLCLTENATKLLRISLFQGSSNIDNDTNLSYAEMTDGDYIPTAYYNFFNSTNKTGIDGSLAEYFLRIPSDAPKTFTIRAPKHSTENLFVVKNKEEIKQQIDNEVKANMNIISRDEYEEKYKAKPVNGKSNVQIIKSDYIRNVLFKNNSLWVSNFYALKPIKGTEQEDGSYEAYLTVIPGDPKLQLGEDSVIILKGKVEKSGKGHKLVNYNIEAVFNYKENSDGIPTFAENIFTIEYTDRILNSDAVEYSVDTNHSVFNMLKNQFKQEMLDAATAIAHYFELEQAKDGTYYVQLDDKGKPKFRKDRSNNKGYNFYHLDKNGEVFKQGRNSYTLDGKVFHSNKFTLIANENGKIVERNYLDELITHDNLYNNDGTINFLYGGAMKLVLDKNGKVIDVIFNDKQNAKIDEALSKFITEYRDQAVEEIIAKSEFIHDTSIDINSITEFAINQLLMAYNFDDLFEGNTKFYKDSQTILKRAKEVQGSGVPYGIADYSSDFTPSIDDVEFSYLNNGEITEFETETVRNKEGKVVKQIKKDENGKPIEKKVSIQSLFEKSEFGQIRQRKGFVGVTIKNSTRTNVKALTELKDKLVSLGVSESHAMDMLFGFPVLDKKGKPVLDKNGEVKRRGGFTETKVNDAQSYITFDEWIRRISARGQLQAHLPLIKKLLDEKSIITANDIKEFVQVQKNFYYDLYYDKDYDMYVPRQIKNAEFVLIPRLIRGTQLEQVYYAMKEAGIDQLNTVETSKAANEELLTLWDNNGNLNQEAIDKFKTNSQNTKQIFSYNNLYTQQETPQHMNAKNKASIQIVKKMYDNISKNSPIYYLKEEFFNLYTENIAESAIELLDSFEIERDEEGNIVLDKDGNIKNLNLKVFYDKLKNEILRRGANSNNLDYVTIEKDSTQPNMPAALMNNVLTMFESVTQSLFNSGITRQTLPGFHAAQVTNIGWKAFGVEKENISYSKELEYHPTQWINKENENDIISNRKYNKLSTEDKTKYKKGDPAPYIEIMLPYSTLGIDRNSKHYKEMTDEQIIKELEKEGLLDLIGYRIPTEGKQSVCVMKIVGFIDDAYGSTIIVPDDWVSQTGSDFDIDSVYGITAETYKTKDGQIRKIEFKHKLDKYDWYKYLRDLDLKDIDIAASNKIIEAKNKLKELIDKGEKLQKLEEEAYAQLEKDERESIKKINKKINKEIEKRELTGRDAYYFRLNELSEFLNKTIAKHEDEKSKTRLINLKESIDNIANHLELDIKEFSENTKKDIDKILNEKLDAYNKAAKEAGLMTLDEFTSESNKYKANSRKARNTAIVENMIKVLQSDEALEENLSRSNFDNLVLGRNNNMSENDMNARKFRSPYNFFHQAKYQEEAMSGAKLKAFSVTLDTFCSICNTVQPTLRNAIKVVYKDGSTENHDKYGWSENNRTKDNYILTSYSSQTTAFILDAIKEGSIPNVTDYTFAVFKTLANVGIPFDTSIAFIMQPGVKRIVDAYKLNKSVFSSGNDNPIHQAIRSIANELGIENADTNPIVAVLNTIGKVYGKEFNKLFNIKDDKSKISLSEDKAKDIPIVSQLLTDRLKGEGKFKNSTPVKELLFDLGNILIYNNLNTTASEISNIARCCNPDKFGAKQTVFATRKVFEQIDKCIFQTEKITGAKELRNPILSVNDKHILAKIYPGSDIIFKDESSYADYIARNNVIKSSAYPTLMAFLKYATATSTIVAKTLFDTQSEYFVNLVDELKYRFNGYNNELSEERYNDFQKYILSSIYNNCPSIAYPLSVKNVDGNIEINYASGKDMSQDDNIDTEAILEETKRIYGYEHYADTSIRIYQPVVNPDGTLKLSASGKPRTKLIIKPFTVQNINKPTEDELKNFEQLSPAQKVQFIKQNFENSGIFELITPTLYNASARGRWAGMQTLTYVEQNIGENVIYAEFRKAFYNKNPLIVSAVIDLVKYAVQVEGLRMSAKAINKVIDNDCLINEFGSNGLGFVQYVRDSIANIDGRKSIYSDPIKREELYENYIRSHKDIKEIRTIYLTKKNISKYGLKKGPFGTYFFKQSNISDNENKNSSDFNKNLVSMGIRTYLSLSDDYITNKYIRFKQGAFNEIYKIKDGENYVILYPLGNLELNENAQRSANESNNTKILNKEIYESLCEDFAKAEQNEEFRHRFISDRIKEYKETGKYKVLYNKTRKDVNKTVIADSSLNVEKTAQEGGAMSILRDTIANHFNRFTTERLFVNNIELSNFIFTPGVEFGSTQKITIAPNDKRSFRIFIPEEKDRIEKDYLQSESKPNAKLINNDSLANIIQNAQDANIKHLNNLFEVVELNENIDEDNTAMASAIEEADLGVINFAASRANIEDDKSSHNLITKFKNKGIQFNTVSLKDNKSTVRRELASYAKDTSKYIKEQLFDMFVEDPITPDRHFSILSDEALALTRNSAILQEKMMKTVNLAKEFINQFSFYEDFNATSEDSDTKRYINDIVEALNVVKKLPISDVMRKECEIIADTQSTNPLIKEDLIDIFEGYWKTYGNMWKFNDLMENGTPILQMILKNVAADIEAKQKMSGHILRDYRNKIKELEEKARRNGRSIDKRKLVTENGTWVRDYNQEFANELERLQKAVTTAIDAEGLGSIEHLKAKLEYDEFKSKHINQAAAPEYYINKAYFERLMLERYPELFSKYSKLFYDRMSIYDYSSKHGWTDENKVKISAIESEIFNLYRTDKYFNGNEFVDRPEEANPPRGIDPMDLKIYSKEAAMFLNNYIDAIKKLNAEYFEYDSVYGFQEQLDYNLGIVADFENSVPTIPQSVLEQNDRYVEARDWLLRNAKFAVNMDKDKNGRPIGLGAKIRKALRELKLAGNNKSKKANQIAKEHNNGEGIYDYNNIPDARKLSNDERQQIRDYQIEAYYEGLPEGSDRVLISNTNPTGDIFSKAFYNRMKVKGTPNKTYYDIVTQLNQILIKYLRSDGIVHIEEIPDTQEGLAEMEQLTTLYRQLYKLKKTDSPRNGQAVSEHIKNNVEFKTNETLLKTQSLEVKDKGDNYKKHWVELVYETDENGNYRLDKSGNYIPNKFLYSYVKPKGRKGDKSYDAWVDSETQENIDLINKAFKKVPTKYYYYEKRRMMQEAQNAHDTSIYEAWYNDNHIYNPYTRTIEPIDCWMMSDYNTEYFKKFDLEGVWVPKATKREKKVKNGKYKVTINGVEEEVYDASEDKSNHNYKSNETLLNNYVKGSQHGKYDSNIDLNPEEIELRDYLQKLLINTSSVDAARNFFRKNYIPQLATPEATNAKKIIKEIGKMIGVGTMNNNGEGRFQNEIGYGNDVPPVMPMTRLLETKLTRDLHKELQELEKNKPEKSQFTNHDEYLAKLNEYNQIKNDLTEKIRKERNSVRNNDWETAIESFLEQSCRYNAIVENKQKLYFLLNVLKDMKMYSREHGMSGNLKVSARVADGMDVYEETIDNNLIKQLENYIRRLSLDQWKESEGALTKIANVLQGFTSANYMMLNIRGGFANVTLGETGILAEAAAGEYFGKKDWILGTTAWYQGCIGFARSGYHQMFNNREVSFNKQDAIVKFFNVVEYDEKQGVVKEINLEHYSQKIRDFMFSPQSMGEHFMQNSVLFAMMMSHRIIIDENGKAVAMSKEQYIQFKQAQELLNIFTDDQKQRYYEFKEKIKNNKNLLSKYAWFRRDALTDFIYLNCDSAQIEKFKKDRKEQRERFSAEFDAMESIYDQCELGDDGKMRFVPNSQLDILNRELADNVGKVTKAMAFVGEFTMKVKKVNNKIHGAYNRQAAAYIEKEWYGSLVMQYHKHLPIGVLKRYMARGHWNETRGSVDKGMMQTFADIANLNLRKIRVEAGLTDEEIGALEGFVYTVTHLVDYFTQLKDTLAIIPNYEKANLLRNLGDAVGVVSALCTVAVLWYIADKDEDVEDSLAFNFFLYESDRLASEAWLYNPLGLVNETKKLMSTPVAAQSVITDAFKALWSIGEWMFDDEYDPYYHSGRFAGEHKLAVYIQRRIPIWNGIRNIIDLPSNNHYYKLGANPIGLINVKDIVTGD